MEIRKPGLPACLTMVPEVPNSGLIVQAEWAECIPEVFTGAEYHAIVNGDVSTLGGNVIKRSADIPTGRACRARVDGRYEVARHQKAQAPECVRCLRG